MSIDASVETTSTVVTQSNVSRGSTVTAATENRNSLMRDIDVREDFSEWKNDDKTRYILPDLLCKKRVDEKMIIETHASDAIVWNIILMTSDACFPTLSPTIQQKCQALTWLQSFKKYLNKIIATEIKSKYCNLANQDKWSKLRKDGDSFQTFDDLVKRTKYCIGKEVSNLIFQICVKRHI